MAERVHVVGVGPDGRPAPTRGVPSAPAAVVAAPRLAPAGRDRWPAADHLALDAVDALADAVAALDGEVVVLASGDPGFFGVGRRLLADLGEPTVRLHPAVSSVAAAAALAGVPWDAARVVSAHGREPGTATAICLAHPLVVVLTAPDHGPRELARALLAAGSDPRELVVAERLGHDDERVRRLDLDAAAAVDDVADPNVVVVIDPARTLRGRARMAPPGDVPDGWALPVDAFDHRGGQVTKPTVRALALAHLGPRTGTVVWDVGAGSGSVAVECARFGAAAVAVERDADQAGRCRANAARHGVTVRVVEGRAPAALASIVPDPDAVFVGGGGADLPAILDVVASRARGRLVVALATLERIGPALHQLGAAGWMARASVVSVHDLAPLGDGHRLAPHNPVALLSAERPR